MQSTNASSALRALKRGMGISARNPLVVPLPRAVQRSDLPVNDALYLASPKADGERVFVLLFTDTAGCRHFCMLTRGNQVTDLDAVVCARVPAEFFSDTVFDAEWLPDRGELLLFDCFRVCGHGVADMSYPDRLSMALTWVDRVAACDGVQEAGAMFTHPKSIRVLADDASETAGDRAPRVADAWGKSPGTRRRRGGFVSGGVRVSVKPVFYVRDSAELCAHRWPCATDGLVYTPRNPATGLDTLKYKQEHTVDFLVRPCPRVTLTDTADLPYQRVDGNVGLFQYNGLSRAHELYSSANYVPSAHLPPLAVNTVWEFRWDVAHGAWCFVRLREDKARANESRTVASTVQCVREAVGPGELFALTKK